MMKCCKDCRFAKEDRCTNKLNEDLGNAGRILVEGGDLMSTSETAVLPMLLTIRSSTHPMSCGPSGQWYEAKATRRLPGLRPKWNWIKL